MVAASWAQIAAVFALLVISTPILGSYLAKVYRNEKAPGDRVFRPVERLVYRLLRIDPQGEQRWIAFVGSAVALTVVGVMLNYLVFRVQHLLPGNPDHLRGVSPPLAFNTAVSDTPATLLAPRSNLSEPFVLNWPAVGPGKPPSG